MYSPIAFGKKTDPSGDYIRKYLPQLKKYPDKYIYSPWEAPLATQKAAGCVIGQDYPRPIVDHAVIHKTNMARMKKSYDAGFCFYSYVVTGSTMSFLLTIKIYHGPSGHSKTRQGKCLNMDAEVFRCRYFSRDANNKGKSIN